MLGLFFISVLFQVFLPTANAVTLLRSPLTNDPNALCNDGSQAVYYHQQVSDDGGDDDADGDGDDGDDCGYSTQVDFRSNVN